MAVSLDFFCIFFHESTLPGPMINRLKWFCWKIRFHRDICGIRDSTPKQFFGYRISLRNLGSHVDLSFFYEKHFLKIQNLLTLRWVRLGVLRAGYSITVWSRIPRWLRVTPHVVSDSTKTSFQLSQAVLYTVQFTVYSMYIQQYSIINTNNNCVHVLILPVCRTM